MKDKSGNCQTGWRPLAPDIYGRVARYLRLSITDRCNLACVYCRGGEQYIPHERILRYEHLTRMVAIGRKLGIAKVRVTGGEPFARKGCGDFLRSLREEFPDLVLSVTTNATLIEPFLPVLARIRPASINLSLDSFDRETYRLLTGADRLEVVLANLDRLLAAGLRVKVNAVALRGVTDSGIDNFLHAARNLPVDFRFIEFMPMGSGTSWNSNDFLSSDELLELAKSRARLIKIDPDPGKSGMSGPAVMYGIEGGKGRLGFISALSGHFCQACNRLRLTSVGNLRACLFDDREYRLGGALRNDKVKDESIVKIIRHAWAGKPLGSRLLAERSSAAVAADRMVAIGG